MPELPKLAARKLNPISISLAAVVLRFVRGNFMYGICKKRLLLTLPRVSKSTRISSKPLIVASRHVHLASWTWDNSPFATLAVVALFAGMDRSGHVSEDLQ